MHFIFFEALDLVQLAFRKIRIDICQRSTVLYRRYDNDYLFLRYKIEIIGLQTNSISENYYPWMDSGITCM